MVGQLDATMRPTPQDNQLMSKHRVLGFKPQLRLEWRRPGWPERNKAARSLAQFKRFRLVINSDEVFGTHREVLKAAEHYFFTAPTFQTKSEKYAWLNAIQAISQMVEQKRGEGTYIKYDIFAVK